MKRSRLWMGLCFVIAIAISAAFAMPARALAEEVSAASGAAIFKPADNSKLEQFKARVYNGLIDLKTEIDVSDIGITDSEIKDSYGYTGVTATRNLIRYHPLFSTICISGSPEQTYNGNSISTVKVTYATWTWTQSLMDSFKARYASFIAEVPAGANELQKALYVHDWICSNVSYGMSTGRADFALGAIVDGKAICAGYSYAYQFLAQQLGLECNYVAGTTKVEAHAWNKVKICGQWFLVDTTWDNSLAGTTNYSHTYCLLNDTEFAAAGDGSHNSDTDVTGNNPVNTSTSFANKYWAQVRGPVSTSLYATDPQLNCSDHVWNEGVVTKNATCVEPGTKTYTCALCGTSKTEETPIDSSAHISDGGTITKEPTCKEAGTKTYKCTLCGAVLKTEEVKALEHTWGAWQVTTPATCAKEGVETQECSVCHEKETRTIAKTNSHSWDSGVVTTAATCTTTGLVTYTCTVCRATKTESRPALGHTWETVTVAATCTKAGSSYKKCKTCSAIEGKTTIAAPGHNYTSKVTKQATCDAAGERTYTCTRCKDTYKTAIAALGHNYTSEVTKQPTCTTAGVRTYTCSRGDSTYTETIAALGHNWGGMAGYNSGNLCQRRC